MSLRWAFCTFLLLLSLATPLFANEITGEGDATTTTTTTITNNNQPPQATVAQTTATTTVVSPHVAAVKVARAYSDEYDEDEDADDDEFPFRLPPAPVAAPAPTPAKPCPTCSKRSIDERIAQKKFRIEQLKALLAKQRAQHAATSKIIADRNREIQARVRAHQQEMIKAADIQRRRVNLQRAEQNVNARKAAAKRAADAKAAREVQALQNQLAAQRRASIAAQQTLERQEREDVARRRVIATQHKHYQKLDAELKAHEAEWIRTRGKLPKMIKARTTRKVGPRAVQIRRRRLLSPKLRRWIIIRTVQQRRLTVRPAAIPSITAARASYQTARNNLKNSLKSILSQRVWKRRAALAAFRKLSEQLSITAAMAQSALIRAHRSLNRKINLLNRRIGTIQRQRQPRRSLRKSRRWSIRPKTRRTRRTVKKFTPKTKWFQRKPKSAGPIRRLKAKWNKKWNKNKPRRNIRFKLTSKPYPKFVSTRDAKLTEVDAKVQTNQQLQQKQA